MADWVIRPMRPDDVAMVERLSAESFHDHDVRTHRPGTPAPALRPLARAESWRFRTTSLVETDAGGCWVAEDDTGMIGCATSLVREKLWILATYAVRPHLQGRGIGRPLLDAALSHGRGCLRGMISSSSDPRAVRRYRRAGFELHPQMYLTGVVDRSRLPVVEHVREAGSSDLEMMDSVDRRARGSAHGRDHALLARVGRPIVSETSSGTGYAYVDPTGSVTALAATDRRTAARLMWAALAEAGGEVTVRHLSAANQWALDVGLAARLEVHTEGYLAVRGMKPPAPYIHHGALL